MGHPDKAFTVLQQVIRFGGGLIGNANNFVFLGKAGCLQKQKQKRQQKIEQVTQIQVALITAQSNGFANRTGRKTMNANFIKPVATDRQIKKVAG
jgi:hypothetical protein